MKNFNLGLIAIILALVSCDNSKEICLHNLEQLRTTLKQTNDTVYAYSLQNHFAIWVHEEITNENMYYPEKVQTLYHYDLKSNVQTKLLTTNEDTLILKNKGVPFVMRDINYLSISPDSMAILIGDAYLIWNNYGRRSKIYMLPLAEKNSLIELGFEEYLDRVSLDVENGRSVNVQRWFGGGYIAMKSYDLPTMQTSEATWTRANSFYIYTTCGEEKPLILNQTNLDMLSSSEICVSDIVYSQNNEGEWYEIPANIIDDPVALWKHYVLSHAYQIEDVFNVANNEVMFDNMFTKQEDNSTCYFELTLNSIQRSRENPKDYIIIGNGFSIMTSDSRFAQLDYPHKVIIEGYVCDMERVKRKLRANPLASILLGGLMSIAAIIPEGNASMEDLLLMDERFIFEDVRLLFY